MNSSWHSKWFYLWRSDPPLPVFTADLPAAQPKKWSEWGLPVEDRKKIDSHLAVITVLREKGINGARVIGGYKRRVAPPMKRMLQLHEMTLDAPTV